MACPCYRERRGARCLATQDELAPSLHERERYCVNDEFTACPTWQHFCRSGARLTEEEYLRLWIPEEEHEGA